MPQNQPPLRRIIHRLPLFCYQMRWAGKAQHLKVELRLYRLYSAGLGRERAASVTWHVDGLPFVSFIYLFVCFLKLAPLSTAQSIVLYLQSVKICIYTQKEKT